MLYTVRKFGESVKIGNVTVTVLGLHRNNEVKLGFTAPPEVQIFREEVREQRLREGRLPKPPREAG